MKYFLMSLLLVITIVGCSAQDLQKDNGPAGTNVNQVYLERDFQEVIHHDCNGNVTLDDIETVSSPTAWVEVTPDNPADSYSPNFVDQQTGSSPSLLVGEFKFQVDYSYGALNMHVNSGVNTINYDFSKCSQWSSDGSTCVTLSQEEQGTVTVNITYAEKTLPGSLSVSDCNPQPSPTPTPNATQKLAQMRAH